MYRGGPALLSVRRQNLLQGNSLHVSLPSLTEVLSPPSFTTVFSLSDSFLVSRSSSSSQEEISLSSLSLVSPPTRWGLWSFWSIKLNSVCQSQSQCQGSHRNIIVFQLVTSNRSPSPSLQDLQSNSRSLHAQFPYYLKQLYSQVVSCEIYISLSLNCIQ